MTAAEAYDLTTHGGATDFGRLIAIVNSCGPWCLIGGLAVNCYVEPVYTLDADLVVVSSIFDLVLERLSAQGFTIAKHPHSVNVSTSRSDLRIQFTTDARYQEFPNRAIDGEVLGVQARIASLEDVTQGKLWAYSDPHRRLSKRKKDELDLIRLAEAWPRLKSMYPAYLTELIERG